MSSVSEQYRCPLCGRTGMGGYHVDGLGIGPICTAGDYACLDGLVDEKWVSVDDFRAQALDKVFQDKCRGWRNLYPEVRERIASFLP